MYKIYYVNIYLYLFMYRT